MIRSTNSFQFHFYFGCFASRNSKGTITFHSFHWWVLGRAVPAIIEQSQLMVLIITLISVIFPIFMTIWGFFGLFFFPWFSLHFSWGVYFNCSPSRVPGCPVASCCSDCCSIWRSAWSCVRRCRISRDRSTAATGIHWDLQTWRSGIDLYILVVHITIYIY